MAVLKIFKIIITILVIIIIISLIGYIVENLYYRRKTKNIKPYGELVQIEGKNIHIYSMGEKGKTIILLPGYGIPLPSAEYGPLMRELSSHYKIVLVEYLGQGFSDESDKKRSSKNYIEETREALKKVNINPPYILMPHSISGIYAEYYANKYPEEIEAMILLDTISSNYLIKTPEKVKKKHKFSEFLQATGFQRLMLKFTPKEELYRSGLFLRKRDGYTDKEIKDNENYFNLSINNTTINQMEELHENIKQVKELPFPEDIPVLKIISDDTLHRYDREDIVGSMEYQKAHLVRLGTNSEYVVLQGGHLIYRNNSMDIKRELDNFIKKKHKYKRDNIERSS